jgi:glycine betaine/choline ABC-type transport system substrate-binding protein
VRPSSALKLSVATALVLAACGGSDAGNSTVPLKPKITIGSTTDPTSELIAEIYGQSLEKAEFRVARKKPFATSRELMSAMASGEVQLTGMTTQALLTLLSSPDTTTPSTTPTAQLVTTAVQMSQISSTLPANLTLAAASTAEDKDVVFCAKTFTDTNTIASLTDLGTKPGLAILAAPDGFDTSTPLGAAALKDTYQIEFRSIVATPIAKVIETVNAGTADCGVGRAADPKLGAATLTVLDDDKTVVPNNVIVPLMSKEAGTADVTSVLDTTSARLTPDSLRALMSRLQVDGATPDVVANEFVGNAGT